MPTYIYETIPKRKNEKPTRFELRQSIKDNPYLNIQILAKKCEGLFLEEYPSRPKRDLQNKTAVVANLHLDHAAIKL